MKPPLCMESGGFTQYIRAMPKTVRPLAILSAVLLIGGYALAVAFNPDSSLIGSSEGIWRVGGLMVYASLLTVPLTAILALFTAARCRLSRRHAS
jgi:hypothetical protein